MSEPHVVVVGAGFGGLNAVRALRNAPVRVTLVDRRNHHLFQPLLYQVATAALSPADIAYPVRSIVRRQRNVAVLLAEAVSIDRPARELVLSDGRLRFDYLVLATGASHAYFGHDEWEKNAPGLKTLEDALEIRRRILLAFERAEREPDETRRRTLLTFIVVGGGPTGAELAGAIAEISRDVLVSDFRAIDPRESRILVLEAGPRILPSFPEDLARKAQESLQSLGVEVRTGCAVTSVGDGVVEAGGTTISAATVLWAAGVRASPLAAALAVPLDRVGRVLVEPDLTIPGDDHIFAIGDVGAFLHQTGAPLPGVAPVAIQQGRYAAASIEADLAGRPRRPFRYRDRGSLAVIGRARAIADFGKIRLSGFLAWLAWCFIHILFLIGFRNRAVVLFEWAWAYATDKRAARLITGSIERPRETTSGA
ncbi:MAG TPA: NAD(P)/FAD-dependent oxidoreductase [Thermoanaerobaculia bacterium]|jgi:NADH dehydrogenase|nr:NAD(P)/FAD-dependent oxidoreductase [Thermoanaerobaculia bacterium]HEV8609200.1 NAD(P)/FAD-dependent oxidoreductase [Thermoanaerobaculia bacterium]